MANEVLISKLPVRGMNETWIVGNNCRFGRHLFIANANLWARPAFGRGIWHLLGALLGIRIRCIAAILVS